MWKTVYASVKGTSHDGRDQVCQDSSFCQTLNLSDETVLVITCADGAGSASKSDIGARLACEEMTRLIVSALEQGLRPALVERELVVGWYDEICNIIETEASLVGLEPREFACTLLTAIVGKSAAMFSQLGDGAFVIKSEDEYRTVFWPQNGEYANTTNFLTARSADKDLDFSIQDHPVDEIAVFTDGLQMLALDYSKRAAHAPFFSPMFRDIRLSPDATELEAPLRAFLNSKGVNDRTDDDKTLILAVRCEPNETTIPTL